MQIIIVLLLIYLFIKFNKKFKTTKEYPTKEYTTEKVPEDPVFIGVRDDAKSFLKLVEEYKKDYFTNSKKTYLLNTYKHLNLNILKNRIYKNISDPTIDKFIKEYSNLDQLIKTWNNEYIKKQLEENNEYFSNIDGKSLDYQQRKAIIVDEDNNLIVAGAGSGKTLTIAGKVKYLVGKKDVNPEKILLISYTKKASEEMEERISKRLKINVQAKTFHGLGYSIIMQCKAQRPDIFDDTLKVIDEYLNKEVFKDKKSISKLINFFGYYLNIPNDLEEFENLGEVYDHTKNLDLETIKSKVSRKQVELKYKRVTLNRETMRSMEEVSIANFLYLNGIQYEYEKAYPFENEEKYRKIYRPDFYLPDYDIYIEHFGITRDYKTPWLSDIESKKYIEGIYWKRNLHKKNDTKLLETYSYMNKEGILLSNLKRMLIENGVVFNSIDYLEVYKSIFIDEGDKYLGEFKKLLSTFLNLYKSRGYTANNYKDIRLDISMIKSEFLRQRASIFMDIFEPLFDYYNKYLEKIKKIDFNDMINMATKMIKSKDVILNYEYIIIDEYQDMSVSRFNLIKEIKNQTKAKIVAVGDDWQSIYRFAGSDIDLFTNFEKYFGYSEIMKIEKTYRNSQELVNIASNFVMKNNKQMKKELISNKHNSNPIRILGYDFDIMEGFYKAIEEIVYLNGETSEILLLGRNNYDIELFREKKEEEDGEDKNDLSKAFKPINTQFISIDRKESEFNIVYKKYPKLKFNFMSVHRSKGLEADNVIILNLENKLLGFPNKLTDDSILSLVISDLDDFDYAEERRLFYVAITRTKNVSYLITPQFNQSLFVDELIRKQGIIFDMSTISKSILDNPSCPVCNKGVMILRENTSNSSKFLGCSNFPLCNNTFKEIEILENQIICNNCSGYMVKREGTHGAFYGCTNYPYCNNKISIEYDNHQKLEYETKNQTILQTENVYLDSNESEKCEKILIDRNKDFKSNVNSKYNQVPIPLGGTIEKKDPKINVNSEYSQAPIPLGGIIEKKDHILVRDNKKYKFENQKTKNAIPDGPFQPNEIVKHSEFGTGKIESNNGKIVKVNFDKLGTINLSLSTCIKDNLLIRVNEDKDKNATYIHNLIKKSDEMAAKNNFDRKALLINKEIVGNDCKEIKYYLRIARCHSALNNIEEAIETYKIILKIDPKNEEAKDFLIFYGEGSIMKNTNPGKKQSMTFHRF